MFSHICVSAVDIATSKAFYDAALTPLGVASVGMVSDHSCLYTRGDGRLLVTKPADGGAATFANGGTIGFAAPDVASVDAFYAAGQAAGGTDEGAPGHRPNAPGNLYGAYLRDPVGNKVCAFCHLIG